MQLRRLWTLAPVSLLLACGSPEPPLVASLGGFDLEVTDTSLIVRSGDRVILDGLLAARDGEASYEFAFGSFKIEDRSTEPWREVRSFHNRRLEDGAVRFELRGAGGARMGEAAIAGAGDGHLTIAVEFEELDVDRASLAFGCDPDEHFLGFGGQSYDVDHRGQTVPIWVQEDGIQKADSDHYDTGVWFIMGRRHSTHTPMPMYVSSRGYGLALDTPYRSVFAMCSEEPDRVEVEAWEGRLALHLFDGPAPAQVIERMTRWTGRPEVPPAFTFAPWLDAIHGSDNVRRVAATLRAEGVASSVIWTEDWRGGNDEALGYVLEEDWEVDRELYPDFEALSGELHAEGFKFLIYHNSFLDSEVPAYAEAVAGGYTIENADGSPYLFDGVKFRETSLLDLSNPEAVAWAQQKYRDSLEIGADGYMADFAEWLPHDAVLASGADPLAAHNLYPVEWQRLNKELFDTMYAEDGVERLFFVRSAYLGSQPLVSVVWAGDQQTDFSAGDGMPSVIPMGIGLGVTGFPYYGHDIAGYMSQYTEPTSRELWFRWVTFGALSPVMRTHHGRSARDNWSWESDAESIAHMARWTGFHLKLFPYLWALAHDAAATGMPMFRPLALDYPELEAGWTATDQFMLGDRLIVAPIVSPGATSRELILPDGTWYPLLGGASTTGGTVTATAGVEDIPVFVPAGAILPLLPDGVDTTVAVADSSAATTLADVGDDRDLWLYPGGASSFTEAGGSRYDWDGAAVTALPSAATFAGAAVPVVAGDGHVTVTLTGPGTLAFDGGGSLVIDGGAADRTITVRLHAP